MRVVLCTPVPLVGVVLFVFGFVCLSVPHSPPPVFELSML